jgi:choline dehydrogenase-like flavoprotein
VIGTSQSMIYVVGSGPAGVSCATALLQKGVRVTLIDPGLELEPERARKVLNLQIIGADGWQPADLAFLKEGTSAGVSGIPLKYSYGSDFPYRDPGVDWKLAMEGVEMRPSYAKGGLSTVWGAAILPYRAEDIRDWPIRAHDLARHYRAVFEFMPLAGRHDLLDQLFPLYSETLETLQLSRQATDFLNALERSAKTLNHRGIWYGASRLAVFGSSRNPACCYCGNCMYGCPFGLIYSSSFTVDALRQNPNFTYYQGAVVDRVVEQAPGITLLARDVRTGEPLRFEGSRVFLACGVLPTTKILLDSLDAYEQPVTLQDSCYFLLPLLQYGATRDAAQERLHTLAQCFLEILDPEVCDQTVHLQVYTYNELYSLALKKLLGSLVVRSGLPQHLLLNRLLLLQGYLPSAYSPRIQIALHKNRETELSTLQLSPVANERTNLTLKNVVRKLRKSSSLLRGMPIGPMLRASKPGRSFHSGGTFPMRETPGPLQSDRYGRPHGFARVHAVDSTVFPSIPATTITLSVMANAHRIGSAIGEY